MMDVMDMPGLTESDRQNLLAGDEKFTPHTWNELKQIIGSLASKNAYTSMTSHMFINYSREQYLNSYKMAFGPPTLSRVDT